MSARTLLLNGNRFESTPVMNPKRLGLQLKIVIFVVIPFICIEALMAVFYLEYLRERIYQDYLMEAKSISGIIDAQIETFEQAENYIHLQSLATRLVEADVGLKKVTFYRPERGVGLKIASSQPDEVGGYGDLIDIQPVFTGNSHTVARGEMIEVIAPIHVNGTPVLSIGYYFDSGPMRSNLAALLKKALLIYGGGTLLSAFLLYGVLHRMLLRPLFRLHAASKQISRGDFSVNITIASRDELGDFGRSFNNMVCSLRDQMERLRYLTHHDALTGLPNRTLLYDRLKQALAHAGRADGKVALVSLDLDRFKLINDTLGHPFGDQLLQSIAERLRTVVSEGDTVARIGDDEFTLLLTNIPFAEDAARVARRVLDALSRPFLLKDHKIFLVDYRVTASIGITIHPLDGDEADILIQNANTAMVRAKEKGTDQYHFYTPEMNTAAFERFTLENGLLHALERGDFFLLYQPRFDLKSRSILGVEALIRWNHPGVGEVAPSKFIPLAEEIGLISQIGEWVLRTACVQSVSWQKEGIPPIRMAVNISPRQLQEKSFVETVKRVLEETGLGADQLEFEITETVMVQSMDHAIATLSELKRTGIHISMDDFGTGYSSLTYLKRLPVDALKMDQSFLIDAADGHCGMAITVAVMRLARRLKLRVIAEGVETETQLEFLRFHQCDEVQGYLLSPPLSVQAVTALLTKGAVDLPQDQARH
jgi:diguanylate cyclase (GGDEF)-like protein